MEKMVENENLKKYFNCLQREMLSKLEIASIANSHPVTKGDSSEIKWIEWMRNYLPKRYSVDKAFIIDSNSNLSDQIDIVIYDKQYTPFVFNDDNAIYVPAESVYAVFEVKPSVNKEHIEYAGSKAASVRKLYRTSAPIPHAEGIAKPKPLHNIIAGILTLSSDWVTNSNSLDEHLNKLNDDSFLNIGCVLKENAFYFNQEGQLIKSSTDESLIYFFLKLMIELQRIATVPAIDITKYGSCLTNF